MKRFDIDSTRKRLGNIIFDEAAANNDIFLKMSKGLTSELSRESEPYSTSDFQPLFGKFKDALDEASLYFG